MGFEASIIADAELTHAFGEEPAGEAVDPENFVCAHPSAGGGMDEDQDDGHEDEELRSTGHHGGGR